MVCAAAWYEAQQTDLGKRFLSAVQDAFSRIQIAPESHPVIDGEWRRCLTKTFPFGIVFRIYDDVFFVLAVMHLHRNPDYWKIRDIDL